ncbi:MAG: glycerophosphodiester phosphodiesterase [Gammaproteobacteria bacterium]|nr:glycerophosphodiester phosphodiesterase [Gammaproteobacteria bacterium]
MSPETPPMLVFAHRGASAAAPENTLRAIRRAIDMGADWIEIDVQQVQNTLVVFHDDTLERTTNGRGPLAARTLTELRSLDAGDGERIPLLSEVLDLIDARVGLNIELKGPDVAAPVVALVRGLLQRRPAWRERLLLSSFDVAQTEHAACDRDGWKLGILFEERADAAMERAIALGADSLHVSREMLSPALLSAAHRAGLAVYVYTVNTAEDLARCLALGVDGVFSDVPDRALALRNSYANTHAGARAP